jgi:FkbM family methyltransferase
MLKAIARRLLPSPLHSPARQLAARWHLAAVRRRAAGQKPGAVLPCLDYRVRINDGPNFYILYKDIFVHRIYHFQAVRPDPVILDCGSNIGMSILYFKHVYPQARVVGFEADPAVYPYLEENVARNGLRDVELVRAGVAGRAGSLTFYSDGKYGSCLADAPPPGAAGPWTRCEVPAVRLRDYLIGPVDFLKMNIEGAEHEVLADSADRLRQVRELILEYHHLPGLPRRLHQILALLHGSGFDYLVNDFDGLTNPAVQPPFELTADTRYYLLVYARRRE